VLAAGDAGAAAVAQPPLRFAEAELARAQAAAALEAALAARTGRDAALAASALRLQEMLAATVREAGAARAREAALAAGRAARLLHAVVRSLRPGAPDLAAAAAGLLDRLAGEIRHAPTLVLEVPADAVAEVTAVAAAATAALEGGGRIEVRPSGRLEAGALRARWDDGWAEIDLAAAPRRLIAQLEQGAGQPPATEGAE
jgi:hypothetical protein